MLEYDECKMKLLLDVNCLNDTMLYYIKKKGLLSRNLQSCKNTLFSVK